MAADHQVLCTKKDGSDPDYRIDGIGGMNDNNTRWYMDEDKAIAGMKAGTWTFYTRVNGLRADVVIRTHPRSRLEYLTTLPDGARQNNLLYLPNCP